MNEIVAASSLVSTETLHILNIFFLYLGAFAMGRIVYCKVMGCNKMASIKNYFIKK